MKRYIYLRLVLPLSLLLMAVSIDTSNSVAQFYEIQNVNAVMDLIHNYRKEHEIMLQSKWRARAKKAPENGGV